jgi:hypothetical protein
MENFFNPIEGFDYKLLNDPDFKEDAVREEIVTPILKSLGYSASEPNRIIRSRRLLHPFVSIGSARKEVYIVPDYLMQVEGKNAWVMEAKAPTERIIKTAHVEQAYSYAIHTEIRTNYFALCNGKEFSLYNIQKNDPLFSFPIQFLWQYWNDLIRFLSPQTVFITEHSYKKDLGLHLKRLGFTSTDFLIFYGVLPLSIVRINTDLFSFSGSATIDGADYVASFDFNMDVMLTLNRLIPEEGFRLLVQPFEGRMIKVDFEKVLHLNVKAIIGDTLEENDKEIFLPLIVKEFISN